MYTVITFEYDGWMIFVYKDGEQIEYWGCDDDDWEQVLKTIEYMNPKEEILVQVPTYKDVCDIENKLKSKDFFSMTEEDINELRNFKTNKLL